MTSGQVIFFFTYSTSSLQVITAARFSVTLQF